MGLLSIFKRNTEGREAPAAKPVTDSADAVQQLRVRARRRLIGAAVLVAIGIIGFPLVFETQPRPIPVDLPIEIPRKEAAAPLPMPAAPPTVASQVAAKPAIITETRDGEEASAAQAPVSKPAIVAKAEPAPAAVEKPASRPAPKVVEKVAEKVVEKPAEKAKPAEAARVQALLEGKAAAGAADKKASDAAGRFIVQVGAFGEANAAREARLKVEKLGLKTYTQVIESAEGKRTRVRVGPFATREEADKVSGRIRAAGLPAAILTL
nr:SPOR domain-containing protein [uncultured Roseateles sp.]